MNTENWTPSQDYPGYITKTFTKGNCTIRVHRPVLTPKERERRMEAVKKAAVKLAIETEKAKNYILII